MSTVYSIAEARNQFTTLIRNAENNAEAVKVMRHGKPVAIILSIAEYERLIETRPKPDFETAYQQFREKWQDVSVGTEDDIWSDVRDKSTGDEENPWL